MLCCQVVNGVVFTGCECWFCVDRLWVLVMWWQAVRVGEVLIGCECWWCVDRMNGEGVEVTEKCGPVVYGQHAMFCHKAGRRELVGLYLCLYLSMLVFIPLLWLCITFYHCTPEGRPGMSDVSPLSGISGLSFDSTLLSPLLFFCLVLLPFLSDRFLPAGPFF